MALPVFRLIHDVSKVQKYGYFGFNSMGWNFLLKLLRFKAITNNFFFADNETLSTASQKGEICIF